MNRWERTCGGNAIQGAGDTRMRGVPSLLPGAVRIDSSIYPSNFVSETCENDLDNSVMVLEAKSFASFDLYLINSFILIILNGTCLPVLPLLPGEALA